MCRSIFGIISAVNQPDAPFSQIYLFWFNTLHVSDGLSVHHQEFQTVHTATGICQTDTASGNEMELQFHLVPASKQVAVSVWYIPVAVCAVWNSWWWTERPSETCRVSTQNKWIWETDATGWFTIEIYCDARIYERQIYLSYILIYSVRHLVDVQINGKRRQQRTKLVW
jgi:hypothetical protein